MGSLVTCISVLQFYSHPRRQTGCHGTLLLILILCKRKIEREVWFLNYIHSSGPLPVNLSPLCIYGLKNWHTILLTVQWTGMVHGVKQLRPLKTQIISRSNYIHRTCLTPRKVYLISVIIPQLHIVPWWTKGDLQMKWECCIDLNNFNKIYIYITCITKVCLFLKALMRKCYILLQQLSQEIVLSHADVKSLYFKADDSFKYGTLFYML